MTLERTFRYLHLRFLRIRKDPEEVARGLAVGVFVGLSPFFGIHMVAAAALAALLKGNKFTAVLGTWVGNPLTVSFILYLDFKIGRWILGGTAQTLAEGFTHPFGILHAGWNILLPMTLGGAVFGLVGASAAYLACSPLIRWLRERRHRRRG